MNIEDLHKELPARIPAQVSDQIQFFLRSYADQQMRFVVYFGQQIDFAILKNAMRMAIFAEPVFSCYYKEEAKTSCWQKQEDIDPSLLIDLVEVSRDIDNTINEFITLEISPFTFPIVRARVIRNNQKDILCINMNHTPADGAGLKEFVKMLALIYTGLIINPEFKVTPDIDGDRSLRQVTDRFTFFQKLKFAREGFRSPKRGLTWLFDWARTTAEGSKFITTIKLSSLAFDRVKTYSKLNNVTINDMVLTAFIRSFALTDTKNHYAAKPVIIPVDLRKYIKPGTKTSICSLTGSLICNIGKIEGNTFLETLTRVSEEMNKKKEVHAEMNRLMQILVLCGILPYGKLKEKLMNVKMPPIPLVTNIGVINPEDINFSDTSIEDAYITGAICLNDNFSMALSTFRKTITFSTGYTGGEIQEQKVKEFFGNLKSELENIQ
jgi:NRPS condensation-like uncharacterized protein